MCLATNDREVEEAKLQMRCNSLTILLRNFGFVIDPSAVALELDADSRTLLLANKALQHALQTKVIVESMS